MIRRGEFLAGAGATFAAAAPPISFPSYAATVGIAVVCALSGPDKRIGERLADGVRAAIDDANRQRGGLDRIFALRTFDDGNLVANAIVNAQFAVADESVVAVVGHLSSKGTLAALRTYAEAQMPIVVPASTDDEITAKGYRNVYRLPTKDFDEGQIHAKYVLAQIKPKSVHALVQDGDYGPQVVNGWLARMNAEKVASKYTLFGYEKPDFSKAADLAIAEKPDHIFLAGTVNDMGPAIARLRAKGYAGSFSAPQGFFDGAIVGKYAKDAEGMVISTSMPYLQIAPTAYRTKSDFEARYGQIVPVAAFAYAATQVVMNAVRRTGAQQRATLMRTLQTQGNYDTLVGSFTFGPDGDPIDPNLYFYTVRDGKLAYLRQAHPSAFLSR